MSEKPSKSFTVCLLLIFLMIFLVGCSIEVKSNQDPEDDDVVYDYFTDQIEDIDLLLTDEITGFVYFGRDTCPNCLVFNTAMAIEIDSNANLVVHKFDTDYWRENENFKTVLDKYGVTKIPVLINLDNDTFTTFSYDKDSTDLQSALHEFLKG